MRTGILAPTLALAALLAGCASSPESIAPTVQSTPSAAQPTQSSPPPSQEPSQAQTSQTYAPPSATAEQEINAKNNKEFAAALIGGECEYSLVAFAAKYEGRTIEFNGSILAMTNHEDYTTRYDIGIAPGDKGSSSGTGPLFKYDDVNLFDLNFPNLDIPYVGVDDLFHFVATVDHYDPDSCLFFLKPISTQAR
ncbi:unannotated protein [freshwater metagenome]|uniref:Unannotated protein n=1 Tax=freshwater metagenome TaxID=449393 RepID=A0A6J7QZP8_9ZZZZ|nr:DUF4839 domain-containing protein [Actinomycetota bacterium]MSW36766.1 DUF4839 domain-containing protein [Actinomycetota bacterium]